MVSALPAQEKRDVPLVDLSEDELPSIRAAADQEKSAQGVSSDQARAADGKASDWFERVDLWGFFALDYIHTQSASAFPSGDAEIEAATLFLEADIEDGASFFAEVWLERMAESRLKLAEAHGHFRRLVAIDDEHAVSFKFGRFDLPFGELYLEEDPVDNLLVSLPIALPYRFDEGVLAYGEYHGVEYALALSDGLAEHSKNNFAEGVTLRLAGNPASSLRLSASVHATGEVDSSALCFAGMYLNPVGQAGASSAGASPSSTVRTLAYVVEANWRPNEDSRIHASFGQTSINDRVDAFDRRFSFAVLQPSFRIAEGLDATLRWSEAGTYDDAEGYKLPGRPFDAFTDYGYDVKRGVRVSAGLRWAPRKNLLLKAEIGTDRYWVIDSSSFRPGSDQRGFVAIQGVLSF